MKTRLVFLSLLALSIGASPALASLPITTPREKLAEEVDSLQPRIDPRVSPATAGRISAFATIVPIVAGTAIALNDERYERVLGGLVIGTGLVLGPSAGYFAAGLHGRGAKGVLLRALVVGGATGAAYSAGASGIDGIGAGVTALALGTTLLLTSAVYDCARVGHDVERASRPRVSVAPVIVPDGGIGAGVAVKF